jgi:predicted alpha/beta-hydrolase family hydrolase
MTDLRLGEERSKGAVSGLLQRPDDAFALYIMAHGAGADMRHRFLQSMADELMAQGVATLRFNFPYTEQGRRSPDPQPVLEAYVRSACTAAQRIAPDLPLFAGGKSMGGRMTSNACAREPIMAVRGLVFLGFPLHAPKKPASTRAEHLQQVSLPMLFLQGTRDDLADITLMRGLCAELGERARLYEVDGADHSFEVRKTSGTTSGAARKALAQIAAEWMRAHC